MNALLEAVDWRTKFAQEEDTEKAFLDMAYRELQDKAAPLMKPQHRLGFEIVDKNEDSTRLVGIFAFRVNKNLYYAPVFFLNGQIKGTDLLYSHGTKSFIPMQEKWLDYIVNSQQSDQGDPVNLANLQGWKHGPNFYQLMYPPGGHKMAEVTKTMEDLNALPTAKSAWLQMQIVAELVKDASAEQELLLPKFLSEHGIETLETLIGWMENEPKFAQALADVYPEDQYLVAPKNKKADDQAKEKIIIVTQAEQADLPDEKKKELISRKYTVLDTRKEDEFTRVYKVAYGEHLSNPTESGVFNVLAQGGVLVPSLVLTTPTNFQGEREFRSMVLPVDDKSPCLVFADTRAVFGELLEKENPKADFGSRTIDMDKMKIGKHYILVDPDSLDSVVPFEVEGTVKSDEKVISFKIRECDWNFDYLRERDSLSGSNMNTRGGSPCDASYGSSQQVSATGVEIMEHGQIRVDKSGRTLRIPAKYKAVEIQTRSQSKIDCRDVYPGDMDEVQDYLLKSGVHKVTGEKRASTGYLFRVDDTLDSGECGPEGAVLRLIGGLGFKEADAREFVALVDDLGTAKLMFKTGLDSSVIQTGQIPDFYMGYDHELRANMQQPQRFRMPIMNTTLPPQQARIGDKYNGEQGDGPDMSSASPSDLAAFAGEKQMKTIFDHGVVGQLAKTYSSSAVIEGYMNKLMSALDALGRTIFLYYWKNEEFVSSYGADDQPELEAKLLGNFKNLGDIILDLKTKSLTSEDGKNLPV